MKFDDFFCGFTFPNEYKEKYGVYSDETKLTFVLELPGCKKDDIDINVLGSELIVKAKRNLGLETKRYQHGCEFDNYENTTKFSIQKILETYDVENLEAEFQNGVLIINFPKIEKPTKKVVIK